MINKIVFFTLGIDSHVDRRIKEFVDNGFDVEAYGGRSETSIRYESEGVYKYHVLYEIGDLSSYKERMGNLPLFNTVIKQYDKSTTLFYFFSLNVAVVSLYTPGLRYIYEESDMLFDRLSNQLFRKLVVKINKRIIQKSFLTVFTSEGFADYYYGEKPPSNIVVIPNKVGTAILNVQKKEKNNFDLTHLKLGFVGYARYKAIVNVSDTLMERFPEGEFHYFGDLLCFDDPMIKHLKSQDRVYLHGAFDYPDGLAEAYSAIDISVCTYDVAGVNTRYAEPNKIYESIYFETPIIVSSNTFLAKKVKRLGIGFAVDSDNKEDIYKKISELTPQQYNSYLHALKNIPKEMALNINDNFFKLLKESIGRDVKKMEVPELLLD